MTDSIEFCDTIAYKVTFPLHGQKQPVKAQFFLSLPTIIKGYKFQLKNNHIKYLQVGQKKYLMKTHLEGQMLLRVRHVENAKT